jgi:hypothetical protein
MKRMRRYSRWLLLALGTLAGAIVALVEILIELISPPKPRRRR